MTKKIEDLERINDDNNKRFNEKIKQQKEETVKEYQDTVEKLGKEKEAAEKKLEDRRNQYKESESTWTNAVNNLEKEAAISKEKITTLE